MQLFLLLPLWYQYTLVVAFGLIIGSFLNVYIYRFHTGRSLAGHSHCLSCGVSLQWFDLFPVASYLVLRGRCRRCGSRIPMRYAIVELGTALVFALTYYRFGVTVEAALSLLLMTVLVIITVYDFYHLIIPNELVIATGVLAAAFFLANYSGHVNGLASLEERVFAAGIAFGFYGLLWFISRGRWIGFGDAKLALPLGFLVGMSGLFSFITLSFWIGAGISLFVLFGYRARAAFVEWQRRRTFPQSAIANYSASLTMKSEVPFAPFIILAFLAVFIGHADVLAFFTSFM